MTWMVKTVAAECGDREWPLAVRVSVVVVCITALILYAWRLMSQPLRRPEQPTTDPQWTYERTVRKDEQ